MPLYAFSLIAVSAIAAWSAVHHGLVAWRQRNAAQRSFALLAVVVAAECIGRLVYHGSEELALLLHLDRLNWTLQLLECWLLLDFVDRFTGTRQRGLVAIAGVVLSAFAVALFALPYGFMATAATSVTVHMLPWGEPFALLDAPYGTAYWLMVAFAAATLVLNLVLAWLAWRRIHQQRHLYLLASLLLITIAVAINVTGDIRGIIIPPLVEHGFAALALVMSLVLTDQALTAARLEERLRRNERLTALGQLAGGVAHDFGNILTGVIGSAELLEGSLASRPKELELIRAVGGSGRRGLALVQQLTAFASGRQAAAERIELHGLLREIATLIQTGRGRCIEVNFRLHAPLTEIDGDPAQLHSLVLNLMVNARDAMGAGGGRILLQSGIGQPAEGLQLRHRPRGEHLVWFSVGDSGPGIAPEVLPRIFDAFFTTKGDGGTGLGLAQVDKALLALGGALAVESLPGHGATFTIWLPLTEDSSCFLRLLIGQTLDALGYRTLLTLDGDSVAVIVTDGDRGDTRSGPRLSLPTVPVVLLGGDTAIASDRTLVLPKPFEPRDLAMALRKIVTRGSRRH
jgi:signal transduction histidine kinase